MIHNFCCCYHDNDKNIIFSSEFITSIFLSVLYITGLKTYSSGLVSGSLGEDYIAIMLPCIFVIELYVLCYRNIIIL